jgi:hypothetical protein
MASSLSSRQAGLLKNPLDDFLIATATSLSDIALSLIDSDNLLLLRLYKFTFDLNFTLTSLVNARLGWQNSA